MPNLDVLIDTELRARAVEAVDKFVDEKKTPVSRSQIEGLLQIAVNEPDKVSLFAGNQKERAKNRVEGMKEGDTKTRLENEIDFWALVTGVCVGTGAEHPWSLQQLREKEMPQELRCKKPPGSASREEREHYHRTREKQQKWARGWNRDHFAGYFRHFCAQYLYRKPPERGENHGPER